MVFDSLPIDGGLTDENGYFQIEQVPVGRIGLSVTFPGYEPTQMLNLSLTSGKELVLHITLSEKITELDAVVISDGKGSSATLNEMATLSARGFDIEETRRYAASINDPARMAMNFAGVTSSGNDMTNEIVIRGNSPRYMLWRLEGIEIPNPNHFGNMGSSGGPISMLSPSTLGRSDFFTGAFPAEFGNALSGVFDLRFRDGNSEHRESAVMVGVLGVEASTEGPFSKKSKASYLINYRYSTLALMSRFVPNLDGVLPTYQDLSFKVNIPTAKAGTFSLFGLGGKNDATEKAEKDSTQWESKFDNYNFESKSLVGIVGLKHSMVLGNHTLFRTVVGVSSDQYNDLSWGWRPEANYGKLSFDSTLFSNSAIRIHSMVNHKLNARHTVRGGILVSRLDFRYRYDSRPREGGAWTTFLNQSGGSELLQAYGQWKFRVSERWDVLAGAHGTFLTLNQTWAVDPRLAATWKMTPTQKLTLSLGIHSRPEHISTYFLEKTEEGKPQTQPNKELPFSKAFHAVAGWQANLPWDMTLKTEAYYQYLYQIPVSMDSGSTFSMINARDIWEIVGHANLAAKGTGQNVGLDLTLEKPFSNGFYGMLTAMIYDSQFESADGRTFNSQQNRNYNLNFVAGKEFKFGKSKQNTLGLNAKALLSGGTRYTPLDLEASIAADGPVWIEDRAFSEQVADYFRTDIGIHFTFNAAKVTHSVMLDVQNITNRQNVFTQWYDSEAQEVKFFYQNGVFPIFNYRVEF